MEVSEAGGSSPLDAVRESFETVAADYAQLAEPMFEAASAERALLAAFAERGVEAFGVDLSPRMIALAVDRAVGGADRGGGPGRL